MRQLFLYLFIAICVLGCTKVDDINIEEISGVHSFTASIEGNDTRVHTSGLSVLWDNEDVISIITNSQNLMYQFDSSTEMFNPSGESVSEPITTVYAVYPYSQSNTVDHQNGIIEMNLPAVQSYANNSFGIGANAMVAVSSSNNLAFKNIGGYLKLSLTGSDVSVKSIVLKGNDGEQLYGTAKISFNNSGTPICSLEQNSENNYLTLQCPDGGIALNNNEPTYFWFVIPPINFKNGITITVTDTDDKIFVKSTNNPVVVERNYIQPMANLEYSSSIDIVLKDAEGNSLPVTVDGNSTSLDVENFLPVDYTVDGGTIVPDYTDPNFLKRMQIKEMTIPEGITELGFGALAFCTLLESITLPESLTTIGVGAFAACTSLTSITIPSNVEIIGEGAFMMSGLQNVTVPANVESIGPAAFAQCADLKSIIIENGVKTIGSGSFTESGLQSVTIPSSVQNLGYGAFASSDLESIIIEEGTNELVLEPQVFSGCTQLETVSIPSNVKTVTDCAFWGCSSLSNVTLNEGVETIGGGAFSDCSSLTQIILPETLKAIETQAFKNTSLTGILTIPDSVERIDMQAFLDDNGTNKLSKVILSNQINIIQQQVFAGCKNLKEIDFNGAPINTIGMGAFSGCDLGIFEITSSAASLTLLEGALSCCGAIGIILPENIISIGNDAFGVEPNVEAERDLKWIYCKRRNNPPALVKPSGNNFYILSSNSSLSKIYLPDESSISNYNVNQMWYAALFTGSANGTHQKESDYNINEVGTGGNCKKTIEFQVWTSVSSQ